MTAAATEQEITNKVDWIVRQRDDAQARLRAATEAGRALAAAVNEFVEDPEGVGTRALREAYGVFMARDAGNFAAASSGEAQDDKC